MVNYFAEDFKIKDRSYIYTSKLKRARAQAQAQALQLNWPSCIVDSVLCRGFGLGQGVFFQKMLRHHLGLSMNQ